MGLCNGGVLVGGLLAHAPVAGVTVVLVVARLAGRQQTGEATQACQHHTMVHAVRHRTQWMVTTLGIGARGCCGCADVPADAWVGCVADPASDCSNGLMPPLPAETRQHISARQLTGESQPHDLPGHGRER